jgi:hypothetical protein
MHRKSSSALKNLHFKRNQFNYKKTVHRSTLAWRIVVRFCSSIARFQSAPQHARLTRSQLGKDFRHWFQIAPKLETICDASRKEGKNKNSITEWDPDVKNTAAISNCEY